MIILIGFVVLVLIFIAFYHGIVIRTISLPSHQNNQEEVRIVVISDLHNARYGTNQKNLINKIQACNPDLIVMPGDMVEDQHDFLPTEQFFQQVTKIAPCYFCTGNHEVRSNDMDVNQIKQWLKDKGVMVLDNKCEFISVKGMEILLCGIDDPRIYQQESQDELEEKAMNEAFLLVQDSHTYRILLAHRPERAVEYQKFGFNCIISGHAHGGQVRMPGLINGLYAPNQGLFPAYAGGKYQLQNSVLLVCRGLCKRIWLPRVFNPPEIVQIVMKCR